MESTKFNIMEKKAIYVYGAQGIGKTFFINQILEDLDYDIIRFDSGQNRNKVSLDFLTEHNMSENNVLSLFKGKKKNLYFNR